MNVLLIFLVLASIDVLVSQLHIIPLSTTNLCYSCDGRQAFFPECLNWPIKCSVNQTCSITQSNNRLPIFNCQNYKDCGNDISYSVGFCDAEGVLISNGDCKHCCNTSECLTKVVNQQLKEYNYDMFCPGRCHEADPATCIQTRIHCFKFQFCELTKDDSQIISGTCRYLHEFQQCDADKRNNSCANTLLTGGHGTKCVMDCCRTNECVNTQFGTVTAATPHTQTATTVAPDPPVLCLSCFGNYCNTSPKIDNCSGGFCMQSVYHIDSQTVIQENTCASREMCRIQWHLMPDEVRSNCTSALNHTYTGHIPPACHYCCNTKMCNLNDITVNTLFTF